MNRTLYQEQTETNEIIITRGRTVETKAIVRIQKDVWVQMSSPASREGAYAATTKGASK